MRQMPEYEVFLNTLQKVILDSTVHRLSAQMQMHQNAMQRGQNGAEASAAELTRLEMELEDLPLVKEYRQAEAEVCRLFRVVDVLVCGHTHLPYHRVLPSGRHVINAGSVGKPNDGDPRACYLILEAQGREVNARFIRVEYDIEQAAQAIEASQMPDEFAQMLRVGKG